MKSVLALIAIILLSACASSSSSTPHSLIGKWHGVAEVENATAEMELEFFDGRTMLMHNQKFEYEIENGRLDIPLLSFSYVMVWIDADTVKFIGIVNMATGTGGGTNEMVFTRQ